MRTYAVWVAKAVGKAAVLQGQNSLEQTDILNSIESQDGGGDVTANGE